MSPGRLDPWVEIFWEDQDPFTSASPDAELHSLSFWPGSSRDEGKLAFFGFSDKFWEAMLEAVACNEYWWGQVIGAECEGT